MNKKLRLLIITDLETEATEIASVLLTQDINTEYRCVRTRAEILSALKIPYFFDAAVCATQLTHLSDFEALQICRRQVINMPFIYLADVPDISKAVEAIKKGANDYLAKSAIKKLPEILLKEIYPSDNGNAELPFEESSAEMAQLFKEIVQNSCELIILLNQDFTIKYVNPVVTDLLGYSREAFMQQDFLTLSHPDDYNTPAKLKNEILKKKGKEIHLFGRLKNAGGEYIWCEGSAINRLHEPKIKAVLMKLANIDEKKIIDETLRLKDNRYRKLAEDLPDTTISFIDKDFRLSFITGQELAKNGKKEKDFIGKRFDEVIAPSIVPLARESLLKAFKGEINSFEFKSSGERYIQVTSIPMKESDDNVKEIQVIYRNITERKKQEEKLKYLAAFNQVILDASPTSIVVIDQSGEIIFANRTWKNFADENGISHKLVSEKANYLAVCDSVLPHSPDYETAQKVANGLRSLLKAKIKHFECEYPCHSSSPKRWFLMQATWVKKEEKNYVTIAHHNITQRRLDEENIKQSEERYKSMFHNSHSVMLIIDPDTKIIKDANSAACFYYGYSYEEICRMKISEINTLSPLIIKQRMSETIQLGSKYHEFKHKLSNGEIRDVEVYSGKIFIDSKEMLFSIVHDVTDKKNAEEKLRLSEQTLKLFVEYAPAAIAMFDTEMNYIAVSKRFFKDYRLEETNIIGRSHYDVFPELTEEHKRIHRSCLSGKSEKSENSVLIRLDGSIDYTRWEMHPWYDDSGKVGGVLFFAEVVTDRVKAQRKLLESEATFAAIFHSSPVGISLVDLSSGKQIDTNEAAMRIFGYEKDDIIDKSAIDFEVYLNPDERNKLMDSLMQNGRVPEREVQFKRKNGEKGVVQLSAEQINIGNQQFALVLMSDITEKKLAEEKIRQNERQYRYLFENNPLPMWAYSSITYKFIAVNDVAVEKYGYSREEFLKMYIADIRPEEDKKILSLDLKQPREVVQHSKNWRHQLKNGEIIDVEITSHTIDIEGENAVLVVAMDVTEKKKTERELRTSEENYRYLFENNPHPMWAFHAVSLKFLAVNESAIQKYGYTREEFLNMTILDIRIVEKRQNVNHVRDNKVPEFIANEKLRHLLNPHCS